MKAVCLKWAALFHDAGKPACMGEKDGRVIFYHHDETGARLVEGIGMRLRWPRREIDFIARLVRLHMRPFHLLNDLRRGGPSLRAMRRLVMEIEADYPALFLLAMADSIAGCGPLKPPELDFELALLWERVHGFYTGHLTRLRQKQRLLTGHDVTARFGLKPGPLIGKALDAIEEARLEGIVDSRDEALSFLETWFKRSAAPS
jgi:poly(A) polymerase